MINTFHSLIFLLSNPSPIEPHFSSAGFGFGKCFPRETETALTSSADWRADGAKGKGVFGVDELKDLKGPAAVQRSIHRWDSGTDLLGFDSWGKNKNPQDT